MNFDNPRFESSIEQLDNGIFFEVVGYHAGVNEVEEDEAFLFGHGDVDGINWSYQIQENADGIACLKYVIEQLTSRRVCEDELCKYAEDFAYFDWETGISTGDMLNILERYGLTPEYYEGTSLQELMEMLEEGKVICVVNSVLLESEGMFPYEGSSGNAYVQIIEIDVRDPLRQFVRLNVPFNSKGAGKAYDLATFLNAWKAGNKAVIFTGRRY